MAKGGIPSDRALTEAIREAVQNVFAAGDMENLTVKRVRMAVEEKLGLKKDFFKRDENWSKRSKTLIEEESVSDQAN